MPNFQYKAISRSGRPVTGQIEAATDQQARKILAEQGRFVQEIALNDAVGTRKKSSDKVSRRLRLSEKERADFLRQLAQALHAQLPIVAALQVAGAQSPSAKVRLLAIQLETVVKSGQSLSHGLEQYPNSFARLHVSLVRVGETSGSLDVALTQLADLAQRDMETHDDILTASLYPLFVLGLGMISVMIVVTWILPRVISTLAASMDTLPMPTRILLQISEFMKGPFGWITLVGLIVAVFIFNRWRQSIIGRLAWDGFKLHLPVIGALQRKRAVSRLARTLGTLLYSGVNILEALRIVRDCLGNEMLGKEVDKVFHKVQTGSSLAEPLKGSGQFPAMLVQVVAVGEQTGKLSAMLLNAAEGFDRETDRALRRFMAIFPATLISILALVVGFIVAATLLPIVQIETHIPL
ncbi:MAG: type II secretion system F family protein [Phycisphaerae bacterium]|nr:type II secretion system F family protein [Phycisphaerae bacterium]